MPSPLLSFRKIILLAGIVIIVAILLSIVLLFANQTKKPDPNAPVTLSVWGLEDEAVYKPVFTAFTKAHPNVTVQYSRQPLERYFEKLKARKAQGVRPDLFVYHNTWSPEMHDLLSSMPVDILAPTDFDTIFYPAAKADLTDANGSIFGLPLSVDGLMLYTNPDMLAAKNISAQDLATWENFYTAVTKLTVKDQQANIQIAGAAIGSSKSITYFSDIIGVMYLQQDINHLATLGKSEDANDVMNFYTRFASGIDSIWNPSVGQDVDAFVAGKAAIIIGTAQTAQDIKKQSPGFRFATAPIPQLDTTHQKTWASYWVWGVHSLSNQQHLAWELAWLLDNKSSLLRENTVRKNLQTAQLPYPRTDMAQYQVQDPILAPLIAQAKFAASFPFAAQVDDTSTEGPGLDAVNVSQLDAAITAATNGRGVNWRTVEQKIQANLNANGIKLVGQQ